jgi:hypothetical protein
MNQKSSSLTGPLWVIAIGILILGIGIGYIAYMLPRGDTDRDAATAVGHGATSAAPASAPALPTRRVVATPGTEKPAPTQSTPPAADTETRATGAGAVALSASGRPDFFGIAGNEGAGVSGGSLGPQIFGRVTLRGMPPPERELPLDAMCGRLYDGLPQPTTSFYVVGPDNGLGDVVVHLKSAAGGREFPLPPESHVIDQVRCLYVPYVSAARAGQIIEVRNSDSILHNVHPTPAVAGNPESNKAQLPKGAPLHFIFPQPELFIRFKCDVHPWMFAYVSLFAHPHFAVTTPEGHFQFVAPPPGRYELEIIHRKAGRLIQPLDVRAGESLELLLELAIP